MTQLKLRRNIHRILEDLPIRKIGNQHGADTLCDYIGRCVTPDLRLQVWDVSVTSIDPIALRGYASNPSALNALTKVFGELGYPCDTRFVKILPEHGDYSFGVAISPECPLFGSEEMSDRADTALEGDTLIILRDLESHAFVHAPNGYLGWVNQPDYQIIERDTWLKHISQTRISDSLRETLEKTARSLLGVPYVWGGTGASGIDCSGFTRYVYQRIGVNLPRDADQQFPLGTISALPALCDGMQLGDLLFFSGEYGGISHVGMALNNHEFIHARGGKGVIVTRIDEDIELMRRFVWSKRIVV